ncbi:MAG: CDP-glycerol glycerophosphotransferase family protein [Opitutaceae bacterium]
MPPTLVICRSLAGIPRLKHLRLDTPWVVASDDLRVQYAAQSLPSVQAVRFIEKRDSFYTVAAEVVRVLEEINGWLTSFAGAEKGLQTETLDWGRNVEGGLTTQRVQDALLLIRFYSELFRETSATAVHLIAEPTALWDDLVLVAVARHAKIPLVRHAVQPLARWKETLVAWLRPHAVAIYYRCNVLRLGRGQPAVKPVRDASILFQLGSSTRKHVENIVPLMLALQARGERPVALCWSASERYTRDAASAQITSRYLTAVRLEGWLTLRDLWVGTRLGGRIRRRIRLAARAPGPWQQLQYNRVALAPLLQDSLRHFLIAEAPQRILYQRALATCLSGVQPKGFKPWAGPESFEGQAALRVLQANTSTPLVFHYWLGASLEWPYADPRHPPDFFLAAGPHEARIARQNYGLSGAQVEIVGQARYAGYAEFASEHTAAASRRELGLPPGRRYIGFDPSGALRGYQSKREQADITAALLRAARHNPGLVIVVKPHPSYPITDLQSLLAAIAQPNVVILDRAAPLKHFLNAVDAIVTKYSSLILEAALMQRAAIAALFDGDDRFKAFGDMPAVVRTPAELEALLRQLGDDAAFASWRANRLAKCSHLLPEFYYQTDQPAAEISAETICRWLEH